MKLFDVIGRIVISSLLLWWWLGCAHQTVDNHIRSHMAYLNAIHLLFISILIVGVWAYDDIIKYRNNK